MNRNTMFQLVFNLVWALPLDTGQKNLSDFHQLSVNLYGRLMLASHCILVLMLFKLPFASSFNVTVFYNSGPLTWFYIYFKWHICNFINLIVQWL